MDMVGKYRTRKRDARVTSEEEMTFPSEEKYTHKIKGLPYVHQGLFLFHSRIL